MCQGISPFANSFGISLANWKKTWRSLTFFESRVLDEIGGVSTSLIADRKSADPIAASLSKQPTEVLVQEKSTSCVTIHYDLTLNVPISDHTLVTGTCDPQQYFMYIKVKSIRSVEEHRSIASFSNILLDVQKAYETV